MLRKKAKYGYKIDIRLHFCIVVIRFCFPLFGSRFWFVDVCPIGPLKCDYFPCDRFKTMCQTSEYSQIG